jgi:hypothetical protein
MPVCAVETAQAGICLYFREKFFVKFLYFTGINPDA